jgi:hypothetical protein
VAGGGVSVASRAVVALSPNGVAALAYAAQGWPVFPCHDQGALAKSPLVKKGLHAASLDPEQIQEWWSKWPTALLGVPTGAQVGHWVLDIDVHTGAQGPRSLAAWLAEQGELPATATVTTASGGLHYLFRWPADGREVLSRVNVAPGIDVRGRGGYVIAPPSCSDKGTWRWGTAEMADPARVIALAPDWLLDKVCGARAVAAPARRVEATAERDASFFARINSKALASLGAWVPRVFPGAVAYDNAVLNEQGYRVSSQALGRALQEDISLMPSGIRDWGEEIGCTPIDVVVAWGAVNTPVDAALWLCQQLGVAPQKLGWREKRTDPPPPETAPEWLEERVLLAEVVPMVPTRPLPPPPEDERPALQVVGGKDFDARPLLRITAGGLAGDVDALEERLLGAGAEIYQQGTRLVRIGQWSAEEDIQRGSGAAVLIDVTAVWLRDCATRLVRFERWDAREKKWRATNCPNEMAETLLARAGGWKFASLLGFCDAPTMTTAGRLVHEPGYDVDSRLFLVHPPLIGALGTVRPEAVAEASRYLFALFDTFPFVTAADEAAALAMVLTTLVRRVLPAAPLNCVSASTPGTGKSLLVNAIATLAVGRSAAVAAIGKDQEELEKRVDAVLLKGDALCSFDNVDRAVKSDVLCQVTTEAFKSVRILGLSRMVDAPTNVCWFMTGNNLTLLGDLVRRTLVCNLDAGMERPELRVFKRDAIAHVRERRRQGIRAALTIVKGYLDAGCPEILVEGKPLRSFGSFEVWDRLVRRPLMWAGWPDPLQSAEGMREQDHEFGGMVDFLRALLEASEGKAMTTAEILGLMRERLGAYAEGHDGARWPALVEAGETVFGPAREWDAQKLGYRLRPWKQRVLGGLKLVQEEGRAHKRLWRVQSVR